MLKFGFGPRGHLYAALQRIWQALDEIRAEQQWLRTIIGIARAEGATVSDIWAELKSAEVRTQVYTAVARENVIDAFGQRRLFHRSQYAPADPHDPELVAYIQRVAEPLHAIHPDKIVPRAVFDDPIDDHDFPDDGPSAVYGTTSVAR